MKRVFKIYHCNQNINCVWKLESFKAMFVNASTFYKKIYSVFISQFYWSKNWTWQIEKKYVKFYYKTVVCRLWQHVKCCLYSVFWQHVNVQLKILCGFPNQGTQEVRFCFGDKLFHWWGFSDFFEQIDNSTYKFSYRWIWN